MTNESGFQQERGAFVVLGASGGIGSTVAQDLLARGASVVLGCRDGSRVESVSEQGRSLVREVDATDFDSVDQCLQAAASFGGGRIAGVVNCVGSLLLKPAHRTSADEWRAVIEANLTSAFAVVRAAGLQMRDGGSVVLCSSAAARVGLHNHEAIAAAKAGIDGLVRSAAASYATRKLRFNAVAPGLVRTPMTASLVGSERALEQSTRMHPLQRIGEPRDVAALIVWLLDGDNDWITGQVIGIDGGLADLRPAQRG